MILGVDHIAIAVKNLDEAIEKYRKLLGIEPEKVEEVPQEKVKIAMFNVGGVRIELLQGLSPDSSVSKFIEKRGEGIHHIALRVDDVVKEAERLSKEGFKVLYSEARVVSGGERKINFIHPKTACGVLLEIVERLGGSHE